MTDREIVGQLEARVRALTVEAKVANDRANALDAELKTARATVVSLQATVDRCRCPVLRQELLDQERAVERLERRLGLVTVAKEIQIVVAGFPETEGGVAAVEARILAEPLQHLLELIEKAGGPVRLSHAVQLGQMSWAGKMTAAIEWARARLGDVLSQPTEPPPAEVEHCDVCGHLCVADVACSNCGAVAHALRSLDAPAAELDAPGAAMGVSTAGQAEGVQAPVAAPGDVDAVMALLQDPDVHLAADSKTLAEMRARHPAEGFLAPIQAVPGLPDLGIAAAESTTPGTDPDDDIPF